MVSNKRRIEETKKSVIQDLKEGLTMAQIAHKNNIDLDSVISWANEVQTDNSKTQKTRIDILDDGFKELDSKISNLERFIEENAVTKLAEKHPCNGVAEKISIQIQFGNRIEKDREKYEIEAHEISRGEFDEILQGIMKVIAKTSKDSFRISFEKL